MNFEICDFKIWPQKSLRVKANNSSFTLNETKECIDKVDVRGAGQ